MQTTIKIKKIYRNEGVSAKGKQWKSVKLLDTNRAYYISFNPAILPQALTEGGTAKIEYENGDRAGSYKLVKVIEYSDPIDASPLSMKTTPMTGPQNQALPLAGRPAVSVGAVKKAPDLKAMLTECKALAEQAFPQATPDALAGLTAVLLDAKKGLLWFEKDMK